LRGEGQSFFFSEGEKTQSLSIPGSVASSRGNISPPPFSNEWLNGPAWVFHGRWQDIEEIAQSYY
jgi:hypothetical protein